jgi:2,3-bisphosphoglycerate-dependent phosphoglycerate mutase
MKKVVCIIRHGESQSNAGEKTLDPRSISLTPNGRQQAEDRAKAFPARPDLIVTSSYIRTQQTAEPLQARFPDVPAEEWNIHEFTFLCAKKYKDTTNVERRPALEEYWNRADPFYRDGDGAESFADFIGRCRDAIRRMSECEGPLTAVYCHGYVMNGIRFCLEGRADKLDADTMREFFKYHSDNEIKNCATLDFDVEDGSVTLVTQPTAPVPPPKPRKPGRGFILD